MKRIFLITLLVLALLAGCAQGKNAIDGAQWEPVYNSHTCGKSIAWSDELCVKTEDLSKKQISSFLPKDMPKGTEVSGVADFEANGSILRVKLYFKKGEAEVRAIIGANAECYSCCNSFEGAATPSAVGNASYIIYQNSDEEGGLLALCVMNSIPMTIRLLAEDVDDNKDFFEEILAYIGTYEEGKPELVLK